jgi:hypothetical protein
VFLRLQGLLSKVRNSEVLHWLSCKDSADRAGEMSGFLPQNGRPPDSSTALSSLPRPPSASNRIPSGLTAAGRPRVSVGQVGHNLAENAAHLPATGHSIVSVPAVTRHGSLFSCSQVSHNLAENAAHLPATGHSIVSVPAVTRHGSLFSCSQVSHNLAEGGAHLPAAGHSIVSVPAVTRHGSHASAFTSCSQVGRTFTAAAAPLPSTGHSIVSVLAVTRHGSLGRTSTAAAALLPSTGHSIVSVPAVTRHGSHASAFTSAAHLLCSQVGRTLLATGHSTVSVPAVTRQGSRTALSKRLTGSDLSFSVGSAASGLPPFGLIEPFGLRQRSRTAICFGQASEEKKEKKVKKSSDDHNRSFCHGILQKTVQVKADLNSGHREGSVAIGPDAIRGRLRELKNVLVIVQIKDENRTKYQSHLSNPFSYMSTDIDSFHHRGTSSHHRGTSFHHRGDKGNERESGEDDNGFLRTSEPIDTDIDIDPPIIAHWFPSLGGGGDDKGSFHRVCPPCKRRNGNDDGGKEKKKNHLWTTTTGTKKAKKRTNGPLLSADKGYGKGTPTADKQGPKRDPSTTSSNLNRFTMKQSQLGDAITLKKAPP